LRNEIYLSVFDLDKTLLNVNSSYHFSQYLYRKGIFSTTARLYCVFVYFRYFLSNVSLNKLHHQVFNALFRGHCLTSFTEQVEPFLSENFEQMKKDKVIDRLNQAKSSGHEILLLSNSPDFLVGPIARRLGISQWASTKYQIDSKGRFNEITCLMDGKEKARELLSRISDLNITPKQTTVYSDSYDDLPLLSLSANPIAVDPDRKLRLISKQRNWKII